MAADLESIVKQLADSGIIAPGKLENFVPPEAHPASADELVAELVKNHHLTQFQAAQVKAGKAKALILGEYTLVDRIGAGGMGQVFKALHRRMERTVAIKMLPPAMTKDAAALARFQREVVAAAKLHHTNIVTAFDAGQAGSAHFLVMEYVEGRDLSATVKQDGPLPVNKAVNYILQAARGLEYAHGEGVVHRDIKPANLLLDKKGIVKILDMGLARIEQAGGAEQAELTGTGTIMGTVDYMSPEQAMSTKNADHRADIYSLGMSLYYLLSGRAAYAGESAMEKLMAHQNQPIPSLQDVQTTVPKQLDAIFKKMVAKRTDERYQAMSDVVDALEALGYGGSGTMKRGEIASTLDLSSADKKKLAATAKKKPLGSLTEVVASEKSKNVLLKAIGGAFGTIIAPILVFYLIRHLDKQAQPPNPPAASVAATSAGGTSILPSPLAAFVPSSGRAGEGPGVRGPVPVSAPSPSPQPSPIKGEGAGEPPPANAPFDAKQAKACQAAWAKCLGTQVETTNSIGMRMTLIPPGEFLMGSTDEQVAAALKVAEEVKADQPTKDRIQKAERPQHRVAITKPLLISATEVTVGQFRKFIEASKYVTEAEQYGFGDSTEKVASDKVPAKSRGLNWKSPGYAVTDDSPVAQVTWNDACAYCAWLSAQEQRTPWYRADGNGGWRIAAQASGYRLPTEAEWEYACRAGTATQYSFGDDYTELEQYGWYSKNAGGKAQPVGLKLPNPFGLFDMHGNLQEWCQDFFDEKWYEKPQPPDPKGPSSGYYRVIRGGGWYSSASHYRSACRSLNTPSYRHSNYGFRCVRPLDATQPETAVAATAAPVLPPGEGGRRPPSSRTQAKGDEGVRPWQAPEFQQWVAATQALPAEQQIQAVSKKLMKLNPGFDGKVQGADGKATPKVENGAVADLGFVTNNVTDISPVRALAGLKTLGCSGTGPGTGKLSDLSAIEGMPLTGLNCSRTQVSDLAPLRGMRLTYLSCGYAPVSDLLPLKGMPLSRMYCNNTQVSDLSPLQGMPLTLLKITNTKTSPAGVAALQKALPNCKIEWEGADTGPVASGQGPAKPWETPAFQTWMKTVAALPAEQQIEAVSKKLMALNPGFDGKLTGDGGNGTPKIENGVVTEFGCFADKVTDISPVRALAGMTKLYCSAGGPHKGTLADLSPLAGMTLSSLQLFNTQVSDLSPLKGLKLSNLSIGGTAVIDLSPLQGMPLAYFACTNTQLSDISALRDCKSLRSVKITGTKVTPAQVAALQKALPNCKIEWDDPAKATPLPQPSPTRGEGAKKKLAYLDPAFQQWVKATQKLPAEQQIEAVSKKLMELNPGFKGVFRNGKGGPPTIEGGLVTAVGFDVNSVTDISPLSALRGLSFLDCTGPRYRSRLSDLSPLRGLPLTGLFCRGTQVTDLSPLEGMMLTTLHLNGSPVTDLSPLRTMPLILLSCENTPVADIALIATCTTLRDLNLTGTKVTAAQVAAVQKALPSCKIKWDDPAKESTPAPDPAGKK